MSKLTKLLRHPGRFLLDSKAVRRLRMATGLALRPTGSEVRAGGGESVAELLEDLARTVRAVDLGRNGSAAVAVLRDDAPALVGWLGDLCRLRALQVTLRGETGAPIDVAGTRPLPLGDFVCTHRTLVATITPRGGSPLRLDLQLWTQEDGEVVGPPHNPVAQRLSDATVRAHGLFQLGKLASLKSLLPHPLATEVTFAVDVVYTWVNHRDPRWRELWTSATGEAPEEVVGDSRGLERYLNRDELRFSLRSVAAHAPWARRIFVVSNCAPPEWLDTRRVTWIDHEAIFPPALLPVFNSHAIESRLQHVPGLADHFVYFNDDVFLLRRTEASDFFEGTGASKAFLEDRGAVHGDVVPGEPDYLNAARNGRRLIEGAFQRTVTALHEHMPHALRRDVLIEMEERFAEPIAQTNASRFRASTDISTVSFLYHHYAYLTGRAVHSPPDAWLLGPRTAGYRQRLQRLLDGAVRPPMSLCLNDGRGSGGKLLWDRDVREFLEAYFPEKSPFEK